MSQILGGTSCSVDLISLFSVCIAVDRHLCPNRYGGDSGYYFSIAAFEHICAQLSDKQCKRNAKNN